eukprot:TRINITY_DN12625_c1_g4_i1.p1 TRINITY_DN12625_c1_g4~~TRINITY_DN12625_c1_g4_i1.p1  ORF type:complete len:948 (+),score=345.06 TRINITY_DN12625_c1_g4_i1:238-3081(+)
MSSAVLRNGSVATLGSDSPRLRKAEIGRPANASQGDDAVIMPPKDELDRQFRELMDTMNVDAAHEAHLLAMSDERKWKLIRGNSKAQAMQPPDFFAEQLRRHLDPEMRQKRLKKQRIKDLESAYDVLRQLEVALRTNSPTWMEEFCDHPNLGHLLMIEFLEDLPKAIEVKMAYPVLQRVPEEHQLGILCLKALMRYDYGFRKVLDEPGFVNRIILNLASDVRRTRTIIMQMMGLIAANPSGGHDVVLDAFQFYATRFQERMRFETVVQNMVNNRSDDDYVHACMTCFINLLKAPKDVNFRIYLQSELQRAGLKSVINQLKGHPNRKVNAALKEYRTLTSDVAAIIAARDENQRLYDEVSERLAGVQEALRNAVAERDELKEDYRRAEMKSVTLEEQLQASSTRADKLEKKMQRLQSVLIEQQALMDEQQQQLKQVEDEAIRTAEQLRAQQLAFKRQAKRRRGDDPNPTSPAPDELAVPTTAPPPAPPLPGSESELAGDTTVPVAPPLPPGLSSTIPPAPPLDGSSIPPPPAPAMGGYAPDGMRPKRRIQPNVALPMLNWVPLRKITDTIFEELDDELVLQELDFNEFEAQFRVKQGRELNLKAGAKASKPKMITVLESNRARNCVITTRRVGMDSLSLRDTVESSDLTLLSAEHAELLLTYVPSEEEAKSLEKHSHHPDRLAEAERFMLETLTLERFETKLRVMAYIGYFDEVVLSIAPQIESVLAAAEALTNSEPFKKLLEVILAFGNYMNSAKRGPAYGFKLQTFERLLDTKSTDRKQTLLHFLVKTVEAKYPHVQRFMDDMRAIPSAATVSSVTLQSDVAGLRKGIDLVLYEREKQSGNFVLHSFYLNAVHKVAKIAERHKMMTQAYNKVCILYNENPDKVEPFDFFAVFKRFIDNYKKAKEDITRINKAAERANGSILPAQHVRNDDIELPRHPVLGVRSKNL